MTVYAKTARFDHQARAMTEDELRRAAPSIFATAAHESRSARFQPIPTIDVLRGLMAEGFMPVGAKQSGTRVACLFCRTTFLDRIMNMKFILTVLLTATILTAWLAFGVMQEAAMAACAINHSTETCFNELLK